MIASLQIVSLATFFRQLAQSLFQLQQNAEVTKRCHSDIARCAAHDANSKPEVQVHASVTLNATNPTPDEKNGYRTTGTSFFGWMNGASRRGPSQNRQYKAGRRRGRFKLPGPPPASERRPTARIKYPSNLNSGVEWAGAEKASGRRSGRKQLRHRRRSPCLSMRTRVCYTTNPTPDEKNGYRTTGTSFFGWMNGASRRGPSQNRQYTRLAGAGGALSYPPSAPQPHTAPAHRRVDGEVEVAGCPPDHLQDGVDGGDDTGPSRTARRLEVAPGDGVGDVRL